MMQHRKGENPCEIKGVQVSTQKQHDFKNDFIPYFKVQNKRVGSNKRAEANKQAQIFLLISEINILAG